MDSPVSPIGNNLYMEYLEQEALVSAPVECKPKYWKRNVADTLEIIKNGVDEMVTNYLNTVDDTGSIKFTLEKEMQFLRFLEHS